MRKFLLLIATLVAMTATAEKENAARRLVTLLTEMSAREEVTPDSFFADVRLLRHEIAAQSDSAACAVYRATLAHLLAANQWRAQARHAEPRRQRAGMDARGVSQPRSLALLAGDPKTRSASRGAHQAVDSAGQDGTRRGRLRQQYAQRGVQRHESRRHDAVGRRCA